MVSQNRNYRQINTLSRHYTPMNTKLFPKVARWYDTLASTNEAAIQDINAGKGADAGAVYWTEEQSKGRGQGNNRWHASSAANLTISIVAYPSHLPIDRLFALTQLTGLAVADTVRHFLPERAVEVTLKWPNDVYVGTQKIAGILVQNGLRGSNISWSVFGIGLNVNEIDFPPELAATATSLRLLAGTDFDREAVANQLFSAFSKAYELTSPTRLPELDQAYHQSLYLKNTPAQYRHAETGELFTAIIRGVAPTGQLRLEMVDGRERLFSLREIGFLR